MSVAPARGEPLDALAAEIRNCRVCAEHLPLGPRPIIRVSTVARVLIASQAPGTRAHVADLPFADASGDRLRDWLGIGRDIFYDESRIAIAPMGFCYPGRLPGGGDRPPRPECAPLWRARLLAAMPQLELTLLVGSYSQHWAIGRGSVSDHVRNFRAHLPHILPLPHPSWRTGVWERRNPWFATDVLPELRRRIAALTGPQPGIGV